MSLEEIEVVRFSQQGKLYLSAGVYNESKVTLGKVA
jgi:hypothetical protein